MLQVRDIYFPHVGQYNHLIGHAHRIAVLENNDLSWVNEESWERKLGYLNETLINWAAEHALPTGIFPEQMHPHTGEALSVSPLTWSHAEFVDAITDYIGKLGKF